MQLRVELLSHFVGKDGVHTDDVNVQKTQDAHPPGNRKELRLFLGHASYYRRFIKGFPKIANPFMEKTAESIFYEWTEEMQVAFDTLKETLVTPHASISRSLQAIHNSDERFEKTNR